MQQVYQRGAAYEARQRQASPYPEAHRGVLRVLQAYGPMRVGRLAAALCSGTRRMEITCDELISAGAITKDDEAFYSIVEQA